LSEADKLQQRKNNLQIMYYLLSGDDMDEEANALATKYKEEFGEDIRQLEGIS